MARLLALTALLAGAAAQAEADCDDLIDLLNFDATDPADDIRCSDTLPAPGELNNTTVVSSLAANCFCRADQTGVAPASEKGDDTQAVLIYETTVKVVSTNTVDGIDLEDMQVDVATLLSAMLSGDGTTITIEADQVSVTSEPCPHQAPAPCPPKVCPPKVCPSCPKPAKYTYPANRPYTYPARIPKYPVSPTYYKPAYPASRSRKPYARSPYRYGGRGPGRYGGYGGRRLEHNAIGQTPTCLTIKIVADTGSVAEEAVIEGLLKPMDPDTAVENADNLIVGALEQNNTSVHIVLLPVTPFSCKDEDVRRKAGPPSECSVLPLCVADPATTRETRTQTRTITCTDDEHKHELPLAACDGLDDLPSVLECSDPVPACGWAFLGPTTTLMDGSVDGEFGPCKLVDGSTDTCTQSRIVFCKAVTGDPSVGQAQLMQVVATCADADMPGTVQGCFTGPCTPL